MEQWAVVLADGLLLAVALAGGLLTVLRARLGQRARMLAFAACVLLSGGMLYQLVWWLLAVPAGHSDAEIAAGAGWSSAGTLITGLVVAIAVGLLFVALTLETEPVAARAPVQTHRAPTAAPAPAANGYAHHAPTAGTPAPASGWTPPQQAQPNDWNIMSGVWSIPRGTCDGPPPEDPNHR
jgi:hypothetical protein